MPVQDIDFDLELKKLKTEYALNKELAVTKSLYSSDIAISDKIPTGEYVSGKKLVKDEDPILRIQKESTDQRINNSLVNTIESYRNSVADRAIVPFIQDEEDPIDEDEDPKPSKDDIRRMLRTYGFTDVDARNIESYYIWERPIAESVLFPHVTELGEVDIDKLEYYYKQYNPYRQYLMRNGYSAVAGSIEKYMKIVKKLIDSKKTPDFSRSKIHEKIKKDIEVKPPANATEEESSHETSKIETVEGKPSTSKGKSPLTRSESGNSQTKSTKKGSGLYVSIPDMVDRLRVLLGEFKSGNKSKKIINEANEILLYLLKMKKINKTEYKKTLKEFNIRV